jgi:hypothetical protein
MAYFIVGAICFGVGLGIGRIKNAAKLKAISNAIRNAGSYVSPHALLNDIERIAHP